MIESAFRVIAICLLLFAPQSKPLGGVVVWKEDGDKCSVRYNVINQNIKSTLHLSLTREAPVGKWTSERTDTHSNDSWAEIDLVVPIRVKGSKSPQFLVRSYRPNWMDYKLYACTFDGVEQVFAFSCRHGNAIKWIEKKGELVSFVTFDRFASPPASLYQVGYKHQWIEPWCYDTRLNQWRPGKGRWQKYRGNDLGNKRINNASDCTFRFKSIELSGNPGSLWSLTGG